MIYVGITAILEYASGKIYCYNNQLELMALSLLFTTKNIGASATIETNYY